MVVNFMDPNISISPETWKTYLARLSKELNSIVNAKSEEHTIRNAQEKMQINYSGKYIVEPFYNPKNGKFDLRLKFEDPKEELMWKLKWT